MIPLGKGLRQYDARVVSDMVSVDTGTETLVQQHFKEEVDINTIVRRFGLTAELPAWSRQGMYGDFTGISDFDSAVDRIRHTQAAFMGLPAEIRDHFKNDPGELVRYASSVSEEEFDRMVSARTEPVAPQARVEPSEGS